MSRMQDGTLRQQRLILVALGFLVVAVLSFAGRMAVVVHHEYRDMQVVQEAERLSIETIGFAMALARERGFTMALLGAPPHERDTLRQRLEAVRSVTDSRWDRLHARLESLSAGLSRDRFLSDSTDRLRTDYGRILDLRDRIDAGTGPPDRVDHEQWFDAATGTIAAAYTVGMAVSTPMPRELLTVEHARRARELSWMLSEYSGRERGLLAYFISAGRPLPDQALAQARHLSLMIDHYTAEFEQYLNSNAFPSAVTRAVSAMQEQFQEHFAEDRRIVHRALESGRYPMSGSEWVERSTHAIDSVIGVSDAISLAVDNALHPVAHRNRRDLTVSVIMVVLVGGVAVFTAARVRRIVVKLFEQQRLAEITLGSIGDGVITTDRDGRIESLNSAAEAMTGWSSGEARGEPFERIFPLVNRYTSEAPASVVAACIDSGRIIAGSDDNLMVRSDGTEVAVFHSTALIHDLEGGIAGTVTVFYDLLNAWSEQHLLSYHGTHDSLTGLINRGAFERRVHALVSRMADDDAHFAICYLDIDQFKVVNDTCGHPAGDHLIKELVGALKRRISGTDLLARLGGDEFGVLIHGCPPGKAVEVAERLRREAEGIRFRYDGHIFAVTLSIGVVPVTDPHQSPAQLLALADAACFTAKEKGRNQVHLYEPDDDHMSRYQTDMMWLSRLQHALEGDEFELYCQPIVRVADRSLFAVEILLRLHQPDTVVVGPGVFIPAAERYGLMGMIDRWVISRTLAALAARADGGDDDGPLYSINLSGPSLGNPGTAEFIQQQFGEHAIAPGRVCFEITETAAIGNFKVAHDLLTRLRSMGCKVALDDFGTGLSSFAYLRDLPIDFIKMAGGFVRDMHTDERHAAMVQATHAVARAMGLPMIAESMGNPEVEVRLRDMGIEYMQGYGIARPMELGLFMAETMPKVVDDQRARVLGGLAPSRS